MKSLWRSGCLGKIIVVVALIFAGLVALTLTIQLVQVAVRAWAYIGVPIAVVIGLLLYKSTRMRRWVTQRSPDLSEPFAQMPGLTSAAIATLFAATAIGSASLLPSGQAPQASSAISIAAPTASTSRALVSAAEDVAPTPTVMVIVRILPSSTPLAPPTPQPTSTPVPTEAPRATSTLVPVAAPPTQETQTIVAVEPIATSTRRPRPRPTAAVLPTAIVEAAVAPIEPTGLIFTQNFCSEKAERKGERHR